MPIAKTIEISSTSPESFGDAIKRGIARATDSVQDVRSAWVKEQKVLVENGEVKEFLVHMMVTFVLRD